MESVARRVTAMLTGILYVSLLLTFVALLKKRGPDGGAWVFMTLTCTWFSDTGAYFAGRAWGRRKLSAVSPSKTVEGSIGGFAGAVVILFLFFFVVIVLVDQIAVFALFAFIIIVIVVFFVVIIVVIVIAVFRNDVQMHGMSLRDFHFGFALWAAQDFSFLHFVLIDVDFCGTFGAANHGNILRKIVGPTRTGKHASMTSVLYTGCVKSTPMRGDAASG